MNLILQAIKALIRKLEKKVKSAQDTADEALSKAIQPDWNQNDETAPDYVKNRPFYITDPEIKWLLQNATGSFQAGETYTNIGYRSDIRAELDENLKSEAVVRYNGVDYYCMVGDIAVEWSTTHSFRVCVDADGYILACRNDDGELAAEDFSVSIGYMITCTEPIPMNYLTNKPGAQGDAEYAEVFNRISDNKASGACSHAEGSSTTASGACSHAEGSSTTASGACSHAEGSSTTASGYCSHAEGRWTTASGACSHAEGSYTTASGDYSHAEGSSTTASGYCSHAEGSYTTASGDYSHTQGKYNVKDTNNKYAHIVGNGESNTARSNAHTLDWNGVPWFQGRPQFGGNAQDDGSQTVVANGDMEIILASSTEGSTKKFKITVNDIGELYVAEVV